MASRGHHSDAEAEAPESNSMTNARPEARNSGHISTGPSLAKDSIAPSQGGAAEDAVLRASWLSFASTAASRDSAAPSIFSIRASTASASTRYSVRQSSIESPISATSPLYPEHNKPGFSNGPRYSCTFCDAAFFSKTEWKLHELEFHDRRERYVCDNCPAFFPRAALLAEHCKEAHGLEKAIAVAESVQYAAIRTAWGCGFCAAFVQSRNDYLEHVGRHYDEGKERSEWQHTRVMEGLLHQPKVEASWTALVTKEEHARGAKLRFNWDPNTTGRSVDGQESRSLQDTLEFFATGTSKADEVAAAAYSAALVRNETNVSDLVSRVFLRGSEPKSSKPVLTPVEASPESQPASSGPGDNVSPISPLPAPLQSATVLPQALPLRPVSSHPTFAASMASRAGGFVPGVVAAPGGNVSRPAAVPDASVRFISGRGPTKQNLLRRTDSARDLAGAELISSQQSSMGSLQVPPISAHGAPDIDSSLSRTSKDSSTSKIGSCLSVKTGALSHVRPHTSSSTLSTRTWDGSQGSNDSTSESMSDDSLSEPDSWLEFDGMTAATKGWKMSFQRTVDRGMGHLWAQYNHDWDALIRQCTWTTNGSSQPQETAGRVRKGTSSRQTPRKGFRSTGRSLAEDDEEDEDDGEGYRPASSLSKRSPGPAKRFACPYRKHDPHTYSVHDHEVCAIRSWSTISRLKEHLYRRHYKIHCQRCKQTFSNVKELADHEMSFAACEVFDGFHPGDMTSYQEKQLKSRKVTSRRQTDEEKWRDIYKLLFPNEEVPSPYPEPAEDLGPIPPETHVSLAFQHFLLTELPHLFIKTAEEQARRPIQTHERLPMEAIPKIVEDSLRRAFREWEARAGSEVPTREASAALMSFLPDTPAPHAYTLGQPMAYPAPSLGTTGMDQAFAHVNFGDTNMGLPSDLPHVSHADDSGFVEGNFFPSEPPVDFNAFVPHYGRGTWETSLGFPGGGVFEDNISMGDSFRGFQTG